MYPILFRWEDAALSTYSLMVALAYFAALGVLLLQRRDSKFSALIPKNFAIPQLVELSLGALFTGFVGARILFFILEIFQGRPAGFRIFEIWEGGIVFYGGFIAATFYVWLKFKSWHLSFGRGAALVVPALCVGHAIGRIGCFLNGCCFGSFCPYPWGVEYTHPLSPAPLRVLLHPVQVYEAIFLIFLGFFLYLRNRNWQKFKNLPQSPALYLILYAVFRFFVEFFRGDLRRGMLGSLSTSQIISLGILIATIFAMKCHFLFDFGPIEGFKAQDESRNRKS